MNIMNGKQGMIVITIDKYITPTTFNLLLLFYL
jgi:hypothetical protein